MSTDMGMFGETKYTVEVDGNFVESLLCSAFEGGSNYWARLGKRSKHKVHYAFQLPLVGGWIEIEDYEGDNVKRLDAEALARGVKAFREKYPRAFGEALAEDGDASTGDLFLQCCLYGEALYG